MPWEYLGGLLLIFAARCTDITLNVFRKLMIVRGKSLIAAGLGFFEVMIYLTVIGSLLSGGKNITIFELLAYGGGFATGNLLGMFFERKLLDAIVLIEVIGNKNIEMMEKINILREAGFGITVLIGEGRDGDRIVAKIICSRKSIENIKEICSSDCFIFISDVKSVLGGYLSSSVDK